MNAPSAQNARAGHLGSLPRIFLLLLTLAPFCGHAANIRAEIDRNPVRMGETLTLTYSADAKVDDPDLSPLQADFEVLGTSTNQQVSMVNGDVTRLQQWEISLAPKHPGTLSIPAVRFGNSQSPTLSLTVENAAKSAEGATTGENMFLEVDVQPKNPYVQAQVIFTVRLLRKVDFTNADLSEPNIPDALVQRIEEGRTFATERGGERFAVVERKYAVFPQKSGHLHIEPVVLNAQVIQGGSRFNSFFAPPTRPVHLVSEAVDLDVRPVPAAFQGKHWLPAESLQLEETWSQDPPHTRTGDPITRTLTLHALGATVGVLPELGAGALTGPSDAIKPYLDQPSLKETKTPTGLASTRQEKVALIPSRAGTYATTELTIPWWNVRTDKPEVARLPSRQLIVEPAAGEAPHSAPPPEAEPEPAKGASDALNPTASEPPASSWWPVIALGLVVGWLATLAAWSISRRRRTAERTAIETPYETAKPKLRQIEKSLRQACEAGHAAAASQALQQWSKARWQDLPTGNLRAVAARVKPELAEEIRRLDGLVYGPASAAGWDGSALWKAFQADQRDSDGAKPKNKAALEPLHRIGEK